MSFNSFVLICCYVLGFVNFMFPLYIDKDYKTAAKHNTKHHQSMSITSEKKPKVTEPYDTKSYWKNPLNTDIAGFMYSITRKN